MASEENASASISNEGELPQVLDEKDVSKRTEELVKANGSIVSDNSQNITQDGLTNHDENHDQLRQMIIELSLQNEYLKNHIGDLNSEVARPNMVFDEENKDGAGIVSSDQENHLHEEIKKLKKEIQEQKETQKAAEAAMEHLRNAHSEADGKVQELSVKLSEVQQKMEQEIKERDEKYVELDSKFGRLHKRAKQRIQELQKEKDDLEARFHDVNTKFEQATSQQVSMQQDLERARQQASEALRSMDVERQQLRTTNSKLRDNVDEMRRALDAKESAIEGLQQSVLEKEQMLEQVQGLLKASEEKRQSLSSDLSSKYQKQIDNLEAQLNDALAERTKAAETISSLQILLAEKDSKIAELDASSTGEAVRFAAAMEELRQKLNHLKNQHENEKQDWEANCQALRTKLEVSEGICLRSEIELAKLRSQLELESSSKSQLLSAKDIELISAKDEISRLESEFSAYKVRAHALLQKKDAELSAAKTSEYLKAHEAALEEAKREIVAACAERDKALEDLHLALKDHDKEITKRDEALGDAEQRIRSITMKLDSTTARYMSEKEIWQKSLESVEENWKSKYTTLEAQKVDNLGEVAQKELEKMKLRYEKLKEEHDAFRNIADRAIEEKEKEIAKLIDDNKNLHHSLESMSHVEHSEKQNSASLKQDSQIMNIAAAEQQILLLASQQAQREEELAQFQRHILALQEEIEELERENRLHDQQEAMLKEELRNMERSHKREGIDMTYLKNVIVKLLETGEVEALLPVVATLLQFSPEETRKCQQVYRSSNDVLSSPAAPVSESPSTAKSMFSRFGFS